MNVANMLTTIRIILVPFFVFFMKINSSDTCKITALIIFIMASLTDAADGIIARKFNLISNFGKFFDPLADKILVVCAMICLVELKLISSVDLCIIISREFLVTSLRLAATLKNKVIAANFIGKLKTVLQITATILILFCHAFNLNNQLFSFAKLTMTTATAITLLSGIIYFIQNKNYVL